MEKQLGDRLRKEDIIKWKLLLTLSGNVVVDSQILIRDPFKYRNETRIMINPVPGIRGYRNYMKKYSGPIN